MTELLNLEQLNTVSGSGNNTKEDNYFLNNDNVIQTQISRNEAHKHVKQNFTWLRNH